MGDATDTLFDRNTCNHVLETLETPEKLFQLLKLEEQLEEWKSSLPKWLISYIHHTDELEILREPYTKLAINISMKYHGCVILIHRSYLISELARMVHLDGYFTPSNRRMGSAVAVAYASIRSSVESSTETIRLTVLFLKSKELDSWLYATVYTFQAALLLLASGMLSHRTHIACWGKTPEESIAHCRYYTQQALEVLRSLSVDMLIASRCFSILRKALARVGQYWLNGENANNQEDGEKPIHVDSLHMLSSLASSSMYKGPRDLDMADGGLEGLLNCEWEDLFVDLAVI